MDGPAARLTSQRSPNTRGALVAIAVALDFAWVTVHIPALAAIGLFEGDPRFYLAYQIGRLVVAGTACVAAVRSGLFSRRELGLVGARHVAALCWLARIVGVVALVAAVLVGVLVLAAPGTACALAWRSLAQTIIGPSGAVLRDLLCMVAVAPLYEELLYRALLLSSLRDRLGEQPALLVSGGVFVALHYVYGYGWHVAYLAVALVLGLVFLRSGSIVPSLVLHAVSNLWFVASSYAVGAAILVRLCPL